jgi:hypothetical protein
MLFIHRLINGKYNSIYLDLLMLSKLKHRSEQLLILPFYSAYLGGMRPVNIKAAISTVPQLVDLNLFRVFA